MDQRHLVFTLICPDRTGIVSEVSSFFADRGGSIDEADFFTDPVSQRFFTRLSVRGTASADELRAELEEIITDADSTWTLRDTAVPRKVVIMVTKESHCLHDIIGRVERKELDMEISCVIGNHEDLRPLSEAHGLTFHHIPFPKDAVGKREAFDQAAEIVDKHNPDAIVLAKFMQILPPDLCQKWAGRAINIHHSTLPAFIGARPYHQAYERGVKLVGATCHFATTDLDDGPIIEQDIIHVTHKDTPADLQRRGRDVEAQVLSRGLRWLLEDRVQVYGNRTVIFN